MTDDERLRAYDDLANDPEYRESFLRLVKQKFPKSSLPEIDAKDALQKQIADQLKTRDQESSELKDQVLAERAERLRQSKAEKFRGAPWYLSDDDIKAVEQLMVDEQIPKFETAVTLYRSSISPLKPNGYGTLSQTHVPKGKDYKEMLFDPQSDLNKAGAKDRRTRSNRNTRAWAKKESDAAFEEIRSGQVSLQ